MEQAMNLLLTASAQVQTEQTQSAGGQVQE